MNFEEAESMLISRQGLKRKGGIPAVREALGRLGNPHKLFKSIHITGTNGKGSVCALLEAACRSAGLRTGMFISPHIVNFSERIQICGEEIAKDKLASLCERALAAGPDLSFFELLTVMAFLCFAEEKTDIAIIEAGIGGLLDSTNVLENPLMCAITSVSFDHKQQLGGTLSEIAFQKAGIIKEGGICLVPDSVAPEARRVIEKEAAARHAEALFVKPYFEIFSRDWEKGSMMLMHKQTGAIFPFALQGDVQLSNASLLWEAAEILRSRGLRISRADAVQAFRRVKHPGRFQSVHAGKRFHNALFILDGAHNPEAAAAFCRNWAASPFPAKNPAYVIAILNDKDRAQVFREISAFNGKFIFTRPKSDRAVPPQTLAKEFAAIKPGADIHVFNEPEEAILKASESGIAAIIGSFYLAGEALRLFSAPESRKKSGGEII